MLAANPVRLHGAGIGMGLTGGNYMDQTVWNKVDALVRILRQTTRGRCAIALAGAHAKGTSDASSDIDIYVFAEDVQPYEKRRAVICAAADVGTTPWIFESVDAEPWGGGMDFIYQGTPVEAVVRTFARMDQVVQDCLKGRFEIIPATWTSNGYYSFIYLCELSFLMPIWDPDGILAEYKSQAAVYPEPLRRSILQTFLGRAGCWMGNFHYESAVQRGDILFTAPIVQHTVLDMIQVVFALNRMYFTGDKKLEEALADLKYCPEELRSELCFLLSTSRDTQTLERQRQLLHRIYAQLRDMTGKALSEEV